MKNKRTAVIFSIFLIFCLAACQTGAKTTSVVKSAVFSSEVVSSSAVSSQNSSSDMDFKNENAKAATSEAEKKVLSELQNSASSQASTSKITASSKTTEKKTTSSQAKVTASPSPSTVRTPKASGTTVYSGNGAVIDVSNSSQGYIMAKCSGTSKRLKLQIKTSKMTYNYDLNSSGKYEVFPLQMGSITYTARIMENVSGSSYRQLFAQSFSVKLESSLLPFLYPNQFVNFNSSSAAVKKASQICAGCSTDLEKLKAIYNFMITEIKYDYAKASSVTSGYLPNVDTILNTRKGICFDYSALMATMLRSQNVPTQLVIGSAGAAAQNHSWNEVYLKGTGWITVKIKNTSTGWKLLDPTFGDKTGDTSAYAAARIY